MTEFKIYESPGRVFDDVPEAILVWPWHRRPVGGAPAGYFYVHMDWSDWLQEHVLPRLVYPWLGQERFWRVFGPINVRYQEWVYRRRHRWGWNDLLEHCPRCGYPHMTEMAYESMSSPDPADRLARTLAGGTGSSPDWGSYSWWEVEVTCVRCGGKYEHADQSI